ncbi:MAG: hypothetical protein JWN49_542 [Parcubacteria group bacterium]|nr:hypothetical protein [Parcubacteria group bacterium]
MNLTRNTLILIVCALIVLGGGAYYFFFFNTGTGAGVSGDTAIASDAELSFIALVSKLDPITFNTAILSDPRFTSRTDIRTTVVSETTGRKDPFAPIAGTVSTTNK